MNIPFEEFRDACKHNDDFEDIECNPICTIMDLRLTKPGPHTYTGKEVLCNEENCPLIKTEDAQKEEKIGMEVKNEIMEKVKKREIYLEDLNRCLAVGICPACGGRLKCISDAIVDEYRCLSLTCTFTYAK